MTGDFPLLSKNCINLLDPGLCWGNAYNHTMHMSVGPSSCA